MMSTIPIKKTGMKLDTQVRCKLALYRFDVHEDHVRILGLGNHPDADDGRRVFVHRFVWRYFNPDDILLPGDIIHHLDGNSFNNHIDNLVKITRDQHRRIHNEMESDDRDYQTIIRETAREADQEVISMIKHYAMV